MKKASIVVNPFYNNNKLFDLSDPFTNRDNCLFCYSELKKTMAENGFDLATSDIHPPEESDVVIYNEAPKQIPNNINSNKSILILFETELILPHNWASQTHSHFKKIFTWNDSIVDDRTYFKINFSHKLPKKIERVPFSNRKFCTLIAGKKTSNHPNELYSKRLEAIKWFEKNHPDDFDYYGMGWRRIDWGNDFINKVAKKVKLESFLPTKTSPCYKGSIESKIETLKNYKFSICYENAQNIPGYITEKIFDCFFAGCIPVYWGAPNILDHIPEECFIDRRKYQTYEELYKFLASMDQIEFNERLDKIEKFLTSEKARPFSAEYFSQTLCSHV